MKLTKSKTRTLIAALEDAISDRESFVQSHYTDRYCTVTGKIVPVVMSGQGNIVRTNNALIKKYRVLQRELIAHLKEAADDR